MHYVILRDDDTNALTPVGCLERLYRPWLDRGLPVNLATIPNVRTNATRADGSMEGFLFAREKESGETIPLQDKEPLVDYLRDNPGYHIVQHGYDHSLYEFDCCGTDEIRLRLEHGAELLQAAGFTRPATFVAPYDRLSRASLREAARRFRVISTGWFEWGRLPFSWWPANAQRKLLRRPHWRVGNTLLLSHPGCLLSCHRPASTMLAEIQKTVLSRKLTVLVTHWWEYFRGGVANEPFIDVLHETGAWLGSRADVKVISFDELAGCDATAAAA
jgi:uncharacterized protein DUF2334